MTIPEQLDRLVELGVSEICGLDAGGFRKLGDGIAGGGVVAIHPDLVPPSSLAPLLRHQGKPGFVVEDMTDLDAFTPIDAVSVPDRPLYLLQDVSAGSDMLDWTPVAAVSELIARGRSPLTISEGISWLLQEPERLAPNRCFMCAGSCKATARGLDARTPAVWISRGTGRDGRARRNSPKVGWCWAGNHHSWLGFASAGRRS